MNKKNWLLSIGTIGTIAATPLMALSCTTQETIKSETLKQLITDCEGYKAKVAASPTLKSDAASFDKAIEIAKATRDAYDKGEKVNADKLDEAITALKAKFGRVLTEELAMLLGTEPTKDSTLENDPNKKDEYIKLFNAYDKKWKAFKELADKPTTSAADFDQAKKLTAPADKDGNPAKGSFNEIKANFEKDVTELKKK